MHAVPGSRYAGRQLHPPSRPSHARDPCLTPLPCPVGRAAPTQLRGGAGTPFTPSPHTARRPPFRPHARTWCHAPDAAALSTAGAPTERPTPQRAPTRGHRPQTWVQPRAHSLRAGPAPPPPPRTAWQGPLGRSSHIEHPPPCAHQSARRAGALAAPAAARPCAPRVPLRPPSVPSPSSPCGGRTPHFPKTVEWRALLASEPARRARTCFHASAPRAQPRAGSTQRWPRAPAPPSLAHNSIWQPTFALHGTCMQGQPGRHPAPRGRAAADAPGATRPPPQSPARHQACRPERRRGDQGPEAQLLRGHPELREFGLVPGGGRGGRQVGRKGSALGAAGEGSWAQRRRAGGGGTGSVRQPRVRRTGGAARAMREGRRGPRGGALTLG
jgi:hypothetical protein